MNTEIIFELMVFLGAFITIESLFEYYHVNSITKIIIGIILFIIGMSIVITRY